MLTNPKILSVISHLTLAKQSQVVLDENGGKKEGFIYRIKNKVDNKKFKKKTS